MTLVPVTMGNTVPGELAVESVTVLSWVANGVCTAVGAMIVSFSGYVYGVVSSRNLVNL